MKNKLAKRSRFARRLINSQIATTLQQVNHRDEAQFLLLVNQLRDASCLLDYSTSSGHAWFCGAEYILRGLQQLCDARRHWIREPIDWAPALDDVTFNSLFGSLARHLLATHDVPKFLDKAWWTEYDSAKQHQMWFRHVGKGNSVLGLRVPRLRSREVVKRFLRAPDHYTVDAAIAWAQKTKAIVVSDQVYPAGASRRREKRQRGGRSEKLWKQIGVKDFFYTEDLAGILSMWQIRQIRCAGRLRDEGKTMRHCVACYEDACRMGKTTIWSMTGKIFDGKSPMKNRGRVLTIEVTPDRVIKTALGPLNRRPKAKEREVMLRWAAKEDLTLDRWV